MNVRLALIFVHRTIYNTEQIAKHAAQILKANAMPKQLQNTILLCQIFVTFIIYTLPNIFHH